MNTYDLGGRTAAVTGAARGIGYAIAKRLLDSGANVMLWDIDASTLSAAAARLGERAGTAAVDVADQEAVESARAATVSRFGGFDILVNNAAILGPTTTTWEYPLADWNQVLHVDLTAIFICCKAVVPGMMERGYGRIVNISSIAGKEGNANASAYCAAKAGVIALTKSLAKEVVGSGVIVNCVTPGTTRTEVLGEISEEYWHYQLSKIPLGRLGRVEETAHMVAWLCSEDCSFSTGAVFDVSGGRATY